jgi:toxin FitB
MILVDTNVISELMRAEPSSLVLSWFGTQDPSALFLSAITEAELRTGVSILPMSQRRERLMAAIDALIDEDFADRVLPFDSRAAKSYPAIAAARRAAGRPIAHADCQNAAIALGVGARIATRNVKDFEGCSVQVINPWDAPKVFSPGIWWIGWRMNRSSSDVQILQMYS